MKPPEFADVTVQCDGSVYLFGWNSESGREFLQTDVQTEPWQWLGCYLVVDHRNAAGLAAAILQNGLTLGDQ